MSHAIPTPLGKKANSDLSVPLLYIRPSKLSTAVRIPVHTVQAVSTLLKVLFPRSLHIKQEKLFFSCTGLSFLCHGPDLQPSHSTTVPRPSTGLLIPFCKAILNNNFLGNLSAMFAKLFLPIFSRAFGCKQCKSEVSYVCISFKNRTAANQTIAENWEKRRRQMAVKTFSPLLRK